jgi:hypothetical protein
MMAVSSCSWQEFFQQQFQRMTKKEIEETVARLQEDYEEEIRNEFEWDRVPIDARLPWP